MEQCYFQQSIRLKLKSNISPWVISVFKIKQMFPNRAKRHKYPTSHIDTRIFLCFRRTRVICMGRYKIQSQKVIIRKHLTRSCIILKNVQILKSFGINTARFLKCAWPFFNIMHKKLRYLFFSWACRILLVGFPEEE